MTGMTEEQWENATDINIDQFTISAYGKTLFQDANLKITAGRRYGLVGPNGRGKTTLLKQLARGELKVPPQIDVLYVEQEVTANDTPAVQMVLNADVKRTELLKEEESLLAKLENNEDLDETELNELQDRLETIAGELKSRGSDTAEARALSLLHGLGFTPDMQYAATKTFSGGWRMRVSIARALFLEPTLMLLDEPTNHLDLNAVIWLDDYLQKWKKTLLIVSHDQDFLDSVCTDIIHLDQKKLFYYRGNYATFKAQLQQHMLKMKKKWEKQEKELRAMKKKGKSNKKAQELQVKKKTREGGAKARKKSSTQQNEQTGSGSLADRQLLERPKEYQVEFVFPTPSELNPPIIQVDNISFNYPNGPTLFKDLSFGLDMDSRVTIVGPNGVGKSTLLKLITQEVTPTAGEVKLNRHVRIARYHQHFVDVLPMDETPVEYLLRVHKTVEEVDYQTCRNRLGKFGLEGTARELKMVNLSGGQKSRVVFTSMSFQHPHMLILDEPTNNLDIESIDALAEAINNYEGGVILVSHDARLIYSTDCVLWVCERQTVEEMDAGFDGYRDEILEMLAKEGEEQRIKQEIRVAQKAKERAEKIAILEERRKAKQTKARE
uniref:ABC transporter domain-containing protein n=1 Tax=Aplanochytrium stocchinoi TaxID=215587 RepID=A0A7S3PEA4_9STRA